MKLFEIVVKLRKSRYGLVEQILSFSIKQSRVKPMMNHKQKEINDRIIFDFSISSIYVCWLSFDLYRRKFWDSPWIDAKHKLRFSLIGNLTQKRAQLDVIWRKISVYIWVLISIVGNFKIRTFPQNMQRFLNILKGPYLMNSIQVFATNSFEFLTISSFDFLNFQVWTCKHSQFGSNDSTILHQLPLYLRQLKQLIVFILFDVGFEGSSVWK